MSNITYSPTLLAKFLPAAQRLSLTLVFLLLRRLATFRLLGIVTMFSMVAAYHWSYCHCFENYLNFCPKIISKLSSKNVFHNIIAYLHCREGAKRQNTKANQKALINNRRQDMSVKTIQSLESSYKTELNLLVVFTKKTSKFGRFHVVFPFFIF